MTSSPDATLADVAPKTTSPAGSAAASPTGGPTAEVVAESGQNTKFTMVDVSLLAMAAIWGVNFSVMKYGVTVFSPLAFNSLRVTLAVTALATLAFAPGTRRPTAADKRRLMALGLLGHALYQLLFVNGLARSRAGTVALLIGATPALIAIFGRVLGVERITRNAALGIAMSMLGCGFVVIGASQASDNADSITGILLILMSSVCWACYTMGLRAITPRVDGVQIAAWTLFGGALPLIAAGIPALLATDFSLVPAAGWGSIAYSGLMAFVLAYVLWYRGVQRIGPTRTSMYANLQPVVALAVAWAALGERPTPWQFAGGACVMSGLYLSRK